MRIYKYQIIICLLAVNTKLYAQKDYLVTIKNDTIKGSFGALGTGAIRFQILGEEKVTRFQYRDIKECKNSKGEIYRAVILPAFNKRIFLKVVEDGRIKLYEYMSGGITYSGNSYNRPEWYASKDESPLVIIKDSGFFGLNKKKREDTFLNLIKDNQSVADLYRAEPKFSFEFIQSLIKRYNLEVVAPANKNDI